MLMKAAVLCLLFTCCFALAAAKQPGAQPTQVGNQASKTFDAKGKLISKTTANGRHYDAKGKYLGKTTGQGRHYDAKGRYTGKTVISNNGTRLYDAKGKQIGKVKGKPE